MTNKEDIVNKPEHYHKGGIDVIGFMEIKLTDEQMEGFFIGNILKYVVRHKHKNGLEDLKKARYYLDKLIERQSK